MATKEDFVYKGYGCPNTEMWTRRAAFEEARPDLNSFIKKDAPHYANSKTRIAYSEWERLAARATICTPEVLAEVDESLPEISGDQRE